jgi:hypothetical protein
MGLVNDFLVSYLDTIDERLLEYLDQDDELSLDAVLKLRLYASSLLDGTLSPDHRPKTGPTGSTSRQRSSSPTAPRSWRSWETPPTSWTPRRGNTASR